MLTIHTGQTEPEPLIYQHLSIHVRIAFNLDELVSLSFPDFTAIFWPVMKETA